jgi:hypothetical protein
MPLGRTKPCWWYDGVKDYLDLDSDNDGIYDLVESGSNAADTNLDGIIDTANFGANGLADSVETCSKVALLTMPLEIQIAMGLKIILN